MWHCIDTTGCSFFQLVSCALVRFQNGELVCGWVCVWLTITCTGGSPFVRNNRNASGSKIAARSSSCLEVRSSQQDCFPRGHSAIARIRAWRQTTSRSHWSWLIYRKWNPRLQIGGRWALCKNREVPKSSVSTARRETLWKRRHLHLSLCNAVSMFQTTNTIPSVHEESPSQADILGEKLCWMAAVLFLPAQCITQVCSDFRSKLAQWWREFFFPLICHWERGKSLQISELSWLEP